MSDEKSLLSRWSQRKAAARHGEVKDDDAVAPVPGDETPAAVEPEVRAEAAAEAEAGAPVLPSIDELDAQSDYTAFLGQKVPEMLQRAALRKLWVSDPVFANLDGLNDYDEDYNLVSQAISLAQTNYRPGIGHAEEHIEEIEAKPARTERAIDEADADSSGERTVESTAGVSSDNAAAPEPPADAPPQSGPLASDAAPDDSAIEPDK